MKKDIVLILGGGGMMGIFTAGVLEVIDKKLRGRIHSIYGTSSGADVGVYFVSGQTHIPYTFFTEHLTKREFIRRNLVPYIFKIFFSPKNSRIKDFINVDYVTSVARNSDCAIDLEAFEKSDIDFYVKVVNIRTNKATYIPAKEDLFQKLKATSQFGPFSTEAVEIGGEYYIDGGTIRGELDMELIGRFKDKKFIYIESQEPGFLSKILLYPLYVLAGCAIMRLYSGTLGKRYIGELFQDPTSRLRDFSDIVFIKNPLEASTFCRDKKQLTRVYEYGVQEANRILEENKVLLYQ